MSTSFIKMSNKVKKINIWIYLLRLCSWVFANQFKWWFQLFKQRKQRIISLTNSNGTFFFTVFSRPLILKVFWFSCFHIIIWFALSVFFSFVMTNISTRKLNQTKKPSQIMSRPCYWQNDELHLFKQLNVCLVQTYVMVPYFMYRGDKFGEQPGK